jgi:hypothetical protein
VYVRPLTGRSARAESWLRRRLNSGPKPALSLIGDWIDLGLEEPFLGRAADRLGVVKYRYRATGWWRLPDPGGY